MALKKMRCKKCGRLLFKGAIRTIEIKCPKCGYVQVFNNSPLKALDMLYKGSRVSQHIERSDRQ